MGIDDRALKTLQLHSNEKKFSELIDWFHSNFPEVNPLTGEVIDVVARRAFESLCDAYGEYIALVNDQY